MVTTRSGPRPTAATRDTVATNATDINKRLNSNLRKLASVFDSWSEEEWEEMVHKQDLITLDVNRDYIEGQMITEALATAQPGEVDPDYASNAN